MKFARSAVLALALAAGSILTTPAFAAPTDAQVTAAIDAYKKTMSELEAAPMTLRQKMSAKSQEMAKAEGDAKAALEAEIKQLSDDMKKAMSDLAAARKTAIASVFENKKTTVFKVLVDDGTDANVLRHAGHSWSQATHPSSLALLPARTTRWRHACSWAACRLRCRL